MSRRPRLLIATVLCCSSFAPTTTPAANSQIAEDERLLQRAGFATDAAALLDFFRLHTPAASERQRLKALIEQLGDDRFRIREQASNALVDAGPAAVGLLRSTQTYPDLEVKLRVQRCLQKIERRSSNALTAAAARLIGSRHPTGATGVLLDYVPFAADALVSQEVHNALLGLGIACDQDRELLRKCLASPTASRRGAAALVLGCCGGPLDKQAVRAILTDAVPAVRLRAAQGLCTAGDKEAMRALIALVERADDAGTRAEDLLRLLAGQAVPLVVGDESGGCRPKCHAAWSAWWHRKQDRLELPRLQLSAATDPAARARAAASRFLRALFRADMPGLQESAGLPFNLAAALTLQTSEEFRQLFQEVMEGHKKRGQHVAFTLLNVVRVEDYASTVAERERDFLSRFPSGEVHVVHLRGRFGDEQEDGALLIRFSGSQARVIGIGQALPTGKNISGKKKLQRLYVLAQDVFASARGVRWPLPTLLQFNKIAPFSGKKGMT